MAGFFHYDSRAAGFFNKLVDCFYVSLIWLIFCIPIVTIGASTTALFTAVRKRLREDRSYVWRSFWGAFKENVKQSTLIWLLQLGLFAVLSYDWLVTRAFLEQGSPFGVMHYLIYFLMIYDMVWILYACAYSSRFALHVKGVLVNSAILSIKYLPYSVVMFGLIAVAIRIVMDMPFFIFLFPALLVWLFWFFFDRIFKNLMPTEEETGDLSGADPGAHHREARA